MFSFVVALAAFAALASAQDPGLSFLTCFFFFFKKKTILNKLSFHSFLFNNNTNNNNKKSAGSWLTYAHTSLNGLPIQHFYAEAVVPKYPSLFGGSGKFNLFVYCSFIGFSNWVEFEWHDFFLVFLLKCLATKK